MKVDYKNVDLIIPDRRRQVTIEKPLAGFDLCCFSPRYDENGRGALLAARFTLEAIYTRLAAGLSLQ